MRTYYDLTQTDIAKVLGMTKQGYSLIETNKNIISLPKLILISNYYKVSMDYFMGLSDDKDLKYKHDKLNIDVLSKKTKDTRIELKLSQRELAKRFNTVHSVVCYYESGKTYIQTQYLYELCKMSNKSMDWFVSLDK